MRRSGRRRLFGSQPFQEPRRQRRKPNNVAMSPLKTPALTGLIIVDGRKCWYEGDNGYPKPLLSWPERPSPDLDAAAVQQSQRDPMDAHALAPAETDFDMRWRGRDR